MFSLPPWIQDCKSNSAPGLRRKYIQTQPVKRPQHNSICFLFFCLLCLVLGNCTEKYISPHSPSDLRTGAKSGVIGSVLAWHLPMAIGQIWKAVCALPTPLRGFPALIPQKFTLSSPKMLLLSEHGHVSILPPSLKSHLIHFST